MRVMWGDSLWYVARRMTRTTRSLVIFLTTLLHGTCNLDVEQQLNLRHYWCSTTIFPG